MLDLSVLLTNVIAPLAVTVLSGVASAVLTLGYRWLSTKWGLDIEKSHRAALHSALNSGINRAIESVRDRLGPHAQITVDNPFKKIALEYVLNSVPDAIAQFNLTPERIEEMILSKIPQVMGETTPPAPTET